MKRLLAIILALVMALGLAACGKQDESTGDIPQFNGLKYTETVETEFATEYKIYRYQGGYSYIDIKDGDKIMVVPEGGKKPSDTPDDAVVVNQPIKNIYMAATNIMALFDAMDGLDFIKFSELEADGWANENARKAMNDGNIIYAGKYSAPDYEMLIGGGCGLAVENTMIYHSPEVKEKLEELGIPVIVERSSYENHPLGRTEWVKLFGEMIGKTEEAEKAFNEQAEKIRAFGSKDNTGKTVAFFYINSRGNVVTYKGDGYIPAMIEISGGEYILKDLVDDSKLSNINMSMEEFYSRASDVDIIIYNSSIAAELHELDQFLALSNVLSDFKAVKEGNVWCTSKSMFQETDKMGSIMEDMHSIITGTAGDGSSLNYIHKLD